MILKTSCAVSGTGFLTSSEIIKKNGGWKCNLLTEDIQFSVVNILEEKKSATVIRQCSMMNSRRHLNSHNQRMRWSKGFYQVMFKYGRELIAMAFKNVRCSYHVMICL